MNTKERSADVRDMGYILGTLSKTVQQIQATYIKINTECGNAQYGIETKVPPPNKKPVGGC